MDGSASAATVLIKNIEAAKVNAIVENYVVATETEASRALLVDLPFLTETISSTSAKRGTRIAALVKMSSALAALAHAGDTLVSSRFDAAAISTIVSFCCEEDSKPDVCARRVRTSGPWIGPNVPIARSRPSATR